MIGTNVQFTIHSRNIIFQTNNAKYMKFQVSFTTPFREHTLEAIKVFWQSRNFKVIRSSENEIILTRGKKGYKWIAINPFKYYFELKCTITKTGEIIEIDCMVVAESDLSKNVFRDILIKNEFQTFENYLKAFTIGKPYNLKSISQIKLKSVWPQYILNLFFPGLGLLFTGSFNGIGIGILVIFYSIISSILNYEKYSTINLTINLNTLEMFIGVIVTWGVTSIIGTILIINTNYEKIYEFDNEQ